MKNLDQLENITPEMVKSLTEEKPASGSRKPVQFDKIVYSNKGERGVFQMMRIYEDEPQISHDPNHLEDTGWFFPVKEVRLVAGNAKMLANQVSQAEYQRIRQSAKS